MTATPAPGIRGLLVDWGGVMTTDVFASFTTFCQQEGISPDAVAQRFASDPDAGELLVGLETGAITEEQFEPRFAELLGVNGNGLIDRLFASGADDQLMHDAVARARAAGVRTGLISNSWGTRRYDRELLARLFDGVVISGEVGIRKPSVRIYELGVQAIGLAPEECVFVDDLGMNLRPAGEMGMATVHHTDAQQTISELEALLSVALR
jgi:putative hydrolase of the HAD superfamily